MNDILAFLRFNWRIIALCAFVALVVAFAMRYDRNRRRFVPMPDTLAFVLDTRTGQYCNPWPQGRGPSGWNYLPRCSDLAKRWH